MVMMLWMRVRGNVWNIRIVPPSPPSLNRELGWSVIWRALGASWVPIRCLPNTIITATTTQRHALRYQHYIKTKTLCLWYILKYQHQQHVVKPKNNIFVEILDHGRVIHTYCVHQEILDGVTWEHIKLLLPLSTSQLCISIHCSAHILCNVLLFEIQAMHYKEKMRKTIRDTRQGAQSELPSITSCQRLRCSIATNNAPRL